jgi:hypothetical protein
VRTTEPASGSIGEVATFLRSCCVSDIGVNDGSFLYEKYFLGYELGWVARGGEREKSNEVPRAGRAEQCLRVGSSI